MESETLSTLNAIAQTIFNKKGVNILALDVSSFSSITDSVIIAEGNVDRHVIALARAIEDTLREMGKKPVHVEGLQTGDWIVLDYLHVMVHLFAPGLRDKYQLEQLWNKGELIDLNIVCEPETVNKSGY